jgi:thioredoxin reductase (NADPH)
MISYPLKLHGGAMNETREAVIIGGGPAGLTAGIYLMRARIKTTLFEKGMLGGAPLNTEQIENYPGFPDGVSGKDLMTRMADQAKRLELEIKEFSQIESVEYKNGIFFTRTYNEEYTSLSLIVALGTEPAKLGIPGEDTLIGRGISYCATCDGMFFRNMEVAVIGGGDAALEEALSLANLASRVYIIHRRHELRAQQILQERARKNERITFLLNKSPIEINGKDQVESITMKDVSTGEETELPISGVFFYVGSRPSTAFLGDLVERDHAGFIVADENLAARIAGLFVAGDVRVKSLRQITTAVGDGALAAVNCERYILEKR